MGRVALMLESDGPGGAETVLLDLARSLRERGHTICPVGPSDGCGWLPEELAKSGFTPRFFTHRTAVDLRCLGGLVRLFRAEKVDVVHSHEFTMAVYGAAAARILGLPHVITMHGGRRYAERQRNRTALRWAFRASRRAVAVSSASRHELLSTLGLSEGEVSVIRNGTPDREGDRAIVREELGMAEGEPLVLAVGNLYSVKGHAVLLRALGRLPPELRRRPWRVAIAGRGEEEARLRAIAEEEGLEDRVHLLGFRPDVPDLLAAADLFVMPSFSEGLPLALVEAMFAARPVVASRVGGIPEVVTGEGDAILVPPGDADALSVAVGGILECPERGRALGRAAREIARADFTLERMAASYEEAYGLSGSRTSP